MIVFEKVIKKYGSRTVLNNINLTIDQGEFVSIIGPSGAGKSTLINVLIGAEQINSGMLKVNGLKVSEMSKDELQFYRRKIGVVFQDYRLLPQRTVYENVAFALEVCGYADKEIRTRVVKLLEVVGLLPQAKNYPHELSGGERQRTALARALVHGPGLIVADEPTGNLDPKTGMEIIKLLQQINQSGVTVVLTTHNKEVVNMLKKRVIKIDQGAIIHDKGVGEYE